MAPENEKTDLRVEDRRNFDKDGNPIRRDEDQEPIGSRNADQDTNQKTSSATSSVQLDFSALVFIYVQTALVHLGELEEPGQAQPVVNLDAARQIIDIIDLLRTKTKGNLTSQEEQYVEKALFDLRLLYVHKAKKSQ
jgi:hypothetical protein